MSKKVILVSLPILLLVGCSSDYDYLVSQNRELFSKVNSMQTQLAEIEAKVAVIEGRKFVQLPTGSPTVPESRTKTTAVDDETMTFNSALQAYKSGDIGEAISQFEGFNSRYPNSEKRADVLYYMGEAYYSQRQFVRAQELLEALVYQYPQNKVNPNAVPQLKRIYQAQGNSDKIAELDNFMQRMNQPTSAY